jgi:phasin family protein
MLKLVPSPEPEEKQQMKPFANAQFDLASMAESFKFSGVDPNVAVRTGRKNVEAMVAANQLAAEGLQAIAKRQAEMIRQIFESATAAMRESMTVFSPEARALQQTDFAQKTFERSFANMRELSELMQKSQAEALEVINRRVRDSFTEMREAIARPRTEE